MKTAIQELLDKLIEDAPPENGDAVSLQLQISSQPYAGSVMRSKDHVGLYEMLVVDPHQKLVVSIYFAPDAIDAIFVPKEAPQVTNSKSGIIIPGAH